MKTAKEYEDFGKLQVFKSEYEEEFPLLYYLDCQYETKDKTLFYFHLIIDLITDEMFIKSNNLINIKTINEVYIFIQYAIKRLKFLERVV